MKRGAEDIIMNTISSSPINRHSLSSAMSPTKQHKVDLLDYTQEALGRMLETCQDRAQLDYELSIRPGLTLDKDFPLLLALKTCKVKSKGRGVTGENMQRLWSLFPASYLLQEPLLPCLWLIPCSLKVSKSSLIK